MVSRPNGLALLVLTAAIGFTPPAAATDAPNWTGFYAGLAGGYGKGTADSTLTYNAPVFGTVGPFGPPGTLSSKPAGFIGGAQTGYNFQIGSIVAGVETDFFFSGMKKQTSANGPGFIGGIYTSTADTQAKWFGTVRGRLGVLPLNNLLIYGTGGFAYGRVDTTATAANLQVSCAFAICGEGTTSGISTGWSAGGGFEYAVTPWITIKSEYIYLDLGERSVSFSASNKPGGLYTARTKFDAHTGRIGLNFRF
jgi:outer membrane immunogenic protein